MYESNRVVNAWELHSDEDLLIATRSDPRAFGAFYRRHEAAVVRFFRNRVRDPEVAADLTAETFAAALQATERFERRGEPASAWLFGIARNVLAMSLRRGRVEARARQRLGMPPLALSDASIERIEALDGTVLELVETLPGDQQAALRERVLNEREYAEIARELECSEAVVRKRVSRALGALRRRAGGAR